MQGKQEVWLPIEGFEGLYEIFNLSRVKSLKREVKHSKGGLKTVNEKILKQSNSDGYRLVGLSMNGCEFKKKVHILVAVGFMGHKPTDTGLIVNHIDFNRANNNIKNLELTTLRINSNQKHLKSTSKYVGVSWKTNCNKWRAATHLNGKHKHLGYFHSEKEASEAYLKEMKDNNIII